MGLGVHPATLAQPPANRARSSTVHVLRTKRSDTYPLLITSAEGCVSARGRWSADACWRSCCRRASRLRDVDGRRYARDVYPKDKIRTATPIKLGSMMSSVLGVQYVFDDGNVLNIGFNLVGRGATQIQEALIRPFP